MSDRTVIDLEDLAIDEFVSRASLFSKIRCTTPRGRRFSSREICELHDWCMQARLQSRNPLVLLEHAFYRALELNRASYFEPKQIKQTFSWDYDLLLAKTREVVEVRANTSNLATDFVSVRLRNLFGDDVPPDGLEQVAPDLIHDKVVLSSELQRSQIDSVVLRQYLACPDAYDDIVPEHISPVLRRHPRYWYKPDAEI